MRVKCVVLYKWYVVWELGVLGLNRFDTTNAF